MQLRRARLVCAGLNRLQRSFNHVCSAREGKPNGPSRCAHSPTPTPGNETAVAYNLKTRDEIEKGLEKVRGSHDWRIPVNIIAEGEVRMVTPSNQSDTVYDTAPLQFGIKRIEKASKGN